MIDQSRLITIIAAVIRDELTTIYVPFWELTWKNDEYILPEKYHTQNFNLVECMWDMKKQSVFLGIVKEIKYLPNNFKVGDKVFYSESHIRPGYFSEIVDVVFEEYESRVRKFKDIEHYYLSSFSEEELLNSKPKDIYELRIFKPWFVLASGYIVKYDMYLYRVKEDEKLNE